ncbi:39S ribosomal protein L42, mitochondrial-like, partial [Vulpes lagopus]|uniref:39S ribosomal protein L42, mitochondrial-like n=1 Tax=Vulpes lagopus TaxID=494514 RepID=UPI001BCA3321
FTVALAAVKWAISNRTVWKHLIPIQNGALYCVCHKSMYSPLPDDYNCKVELALTSDGRTIVCYHPSVDIPYEHTKPIPRPYPVHNNEETHDQVLKTRLEEKNEHFEQGLMIEQLSKMFFTIKHHWYPCGQYHRRRRKLDPPKDR